MTTKKSASATLKTRLPAVRQRSAYHRVDALLHTMRCITQYEDALCEISHELKGTTTLSEEVGRELRLILEKMPSHDYLVDLDSVRAMLAKSRPSKSSGSKKATKPATGGKKTIASKKKLGRKSSR